MLLKDFIKEGTLALSSLYGAPEARNIIQILCQERLGTKSYTHIIEPEYSIKPSLLPLLQGDLLKLQNAVPLQYVLGKAQFFSRDFRVDPNVLIPRPETEKLCQEAIKIALMKSRVRSAYGAAASSPRVLDLCTGSGCIAWTMALEVPGCEVVATDISEAALAVAVSQKFPNIRKFPKVIPPSFVRCDVLAPQPSFEEGKFDILLSNPPYVLESQRVSMRRNVLDHEPSLALFVPDDDPLLFYKAIFRWASLFLREDGVGIVEVNDILSHQTAGIFLSGGFSKVEIIKDCFEKDRFVLFSRV